LNKLDGNDKLDELLQEVMKSTDSLQKLGQETGVINPPDRQTNE
jgi:type VI secretion system protein ImpB